MNCKIKKSFQPGLSDEQVDKLGNSSYASWESILSSLAMYFNTTPARIKSLVADQEGVTITLKEKL